MMRFLTKVAAFAALLLLPAESQTIVDVASSNADFSTLVDLVVQAGLAETLSGEGPFTVFAPTNDAFAQVPPDVLAALAADTEALTKVLTYHVVAGNFTSDQLTNGEVTTVEGSSLTVTIGDQVLINDAAVVTPDILASNGVIHVIEKVLIPPGLLDETEPGTPPDATAAPQATTAPEATPPPDVTDGQTIVDIATSNADFSTLVDLVVQAGLAETLSGEGPFTVFAPTDDAFAQVSFDVLAALAADPEALAKVLTYHVVSGNLTSDQLTTGEVTTLEGSSVTVTVGDSVLINNATVVTPDILASNGVIHIIDQVLIPPDLYASAGPTTPPAAATPAPEVSSDATRLTNSVAPLFLLVSGFMVFFI